MLGANHIRVRCEDGVTRTGRIKGKIKKRLGSARGSPDRCSWSFQDEKCDIVYRYIRPQVDWLQKHNYIK